MNKEQKREIIIIIQNRFDRKENFVVWIHKNLKLKIYKNFSYENIIKIIENSGKEKEFCKKLYNLTSFIEIIEKYDIIDAMEAFSKENLVLFAERLSNHKQKWRYSKTTRGGLTNSLVKNTTKNDFKELFPQLILEKKITSPLIQYYKSVTGPLGITRAIVERKATEADNVVGLLSKFITKDLYDEFKKQTKFSSQIRMDLDKKLFPIQLQQLIISYCTNEQIHMIFNKLIENGTLKIKKVEDYCPFIITPCGMFTDFPEDPIEELVNILIKELPKQELDEELKSKGYESGPLKLRLHGQFLKTKPEEIINKMFGMPQLKSLAKELKFARTDVTSKDDLIRYLLIRLGFFIPTRVEGLTQHIEVLENYQKQVKGEKIPEKVAGIMTNVYVIGEKILKDLIYFYSSCIWPEINNLENKESKVKEVQKKIETELKGRKDPFSRPSFGVLVDILFEINEYTATNKKLKKLIQNEFGRKNLFPPNELDILRIINQNRSQFTHDSSEDTPSTILSPFKIIGELINVVRKFQMRKIFPIAFFVQRQIINEYDVTYLEVRAEDGRDWTVKTDEWIKPGLTGLMYSKTDLTAINPQIIAKFW